MALFNVSDLNGVLSLVGILSLSCVALKTLCRLVRGFRAYVLPKLFPPDLKRYGSWAIITGSTDGIGKAYAEELARKGINVFLISRSATKLEQVATEIKKYGVQVKTLAIDFSSNDNIFDKIKKEVHTLDGIGILVNNVGVAYDYPDYFGDVEDGEQFFQNMIRVNMTSMTMMTHMVLPKMLENKRGLVINLSSASGQAIPMPLLTVYSASKAYVDFFSRALHQEYSSRGIMIQSVLPGFVATNMTKVTRARLDVPSAQTYARSALGTAGTFERTNGYWVHSFQTWLLSELMPSWLAKRILFRDLSQLRKSRLRRKEREGKRK